MHDGILIEKHGKPAVVICTNPFIATADMTARIHGIPGYPYVVLSHPVGSLSDGELWKRARQVLPTVLQILLDTRRGG